MAKKTKTTDQRTLVTFLLDETGSMESIKDDTIGGFNAYLGKLKTTPTIDFSLIKFDSRRIEKVCVATPIADVPELTNETYSPGASTPLIDAAVKTIRAVEKSLNGKQPKVVVAIQTDGQENASVEHTWDELNALIKEKTAAGWEFQFLGTGIDAYETGTRMGVSTANTMSSGKTSANIRSSFAAMGQSTSNYTAGLAGSASLSMQDRSVSGDAHAGKYFNADGSLKNPGGSGGTGARVHPSKPAAKVQMVEDFDL